MWPGEALSARPLPIGKLWLVDIRADGTAACRTLEAVPPAGGAPDRPLASTPAEFAAGDYAATTADRLRTDLRAALVADGLFEDEADALLNTWDVSYFKSAGLRMFFLVPQPWTDAVLPLTVTGVSHISRVMVGRIELVTPRQREAARPPRRHTAERPGTRAYSWRRCVSAWKRAPPFGPRWPTAGNHWSRRVSPCRRRTRPISTSGGFGTP